MTGPKQFPLERMLAIFYNVIEVSKTALNSFPWSVCSLYSTMLLRQVHPPWTVPIGVVAGIRIRLFLIIQCEVFFGLDVEFSLGASALISTEWWLTVFYYYYEQQFVFVSPGSAMFRIFCSFNVNIKDYFELP